MRFIKEGVVNSGTDNIAGGTISSILHIHGIPGSKVHEANMRLTWVLSAPEGPYVGPVNFAIRDTKESGDFNNKSIITCLLTNQTRKCGWKYWTNNKDTFD